MLSTQSLREQLNLYVNGSLSIESLEAWLASEGWDMARWAPIGLQRMVESIQSALIRNANGDLPDDELASLLRSKHEQLLRAKAVTRAVGDDLPVHDVVRVNRPKAAISVGDAVTEVVSASAAV